MSTIYELFLSDFYMGKTIAHLLLLYTRPTYTYLLIKVLFLILIFKFKKQLSHVNKYFVGNEWFIFTFVGHAELEFSLSILFYLHSTEYADIKLRQFRHLIRFRT